jgi:hypothetical protein
MICFRNRMAFWFLAVALACLNAGCQRPEEGPPRFHLSGTVTYDGKPVPKGFINFNPAEGNSGPASGAPIVDGKYETPKGKGIIGGPHIVIITGSDGIPYEESGETVEGGKQLFPRYQTTVDFPKEDGEKNFEVPKTQENSESKTPE